jgi:hypothetical protein
MEPSDTLVIKNDYYYEDIEGVWSCICAFATPSMTALLSALSPQVQLASPIFSGNAARLRSADGAFRQSGQPYANGSLPRLKLPSQPGRAWRRSEAYAVGAPKASSFLRITLTRGSPSRPSDKGAFVLPACAKAA